MRLFEFNQVDQLITKLDKVDNPEDPDFNIKIPAPIKVDHSGDVWDYAEGFECDDRSHDTVRAIRDEIKNSKPSVEMIPHNIMITGQDYVSGEGLKQYLEHPSDKLPLIYLHDGKYVVLDGNHRIVADILLGKKATKCNVKNVDKWIQPDGCFI
jgi:hypothetical protein